MRILVTGATGLIGKSLVPLLSENGFFVRTTSREIESYSISKISSLKENVFFDLGADENDYIILLEDIDVVIHLAAKVHDVSISKKDSEKYFKINSDGTEKLAKQALLHGVKRFIFLSSIKVNGESNISDAKGKILAFNEGDDPHPQGAYAKSKLEAEDAIRKICHESEMDYVILRPTLVYGSGVRANFLSLIDAVNKNYPLPLASIKNKRSLLYVGNLIHAISLCVNNSEVANQTYLISDTNISVPELVRKIATLLGKRALLFPFPVSYLRTIGSLTGKKQIINRLTDSLLADNKSICKDLKWVPPYGFDEGLQVTVDWYLQR